MSCKRWKCDDLYELQRHLSRTKGGLQRPNTAASSACEVEFIYLFTNQTTEGVSIHQFAN